MVRIRFIIGMFLFYSGILHADKIDDKIQKECAKDSPSNYFGTYIVDYYAKKSFHEYSIENEKYIGDKIVNKNYIIKKNVYKSVRWAKRENPIYRIECIRLYKEEGEVHNKKYSFFHGFGEDRNYIKLLKIYENKEQMMKGIHINYFEIDDPNELWLSRGGITLILKKY